MFLMYHIFTKALVQSFLSVFKTKRSDEDDDDDDESNSPKNAIYLLKFNYFKIKVVFD